MAHQRHRWRRAALQPCRQSRPGSSRQKMDAVGMPLLTGSVTTGFLRQSAQVMRCANHVPLQRRQPMPQTATPRAPPTQAKRLSLFWRRRHPVQVRNTPDEGGSCRGAATEDPPVEPATGLHDAPLEHPVSIAQGPHSQHKVEGKHTTHATVSAGQQPRNTTDRSRRDCHRWATPGVPKCFHDCYTAGCPCRSDFRPASSSWSCCWGVRGSFPATAACRPCRRRRRRQDLDG